MSEQQTQYPDHFVDRLEILWGEGFLSPGGPDEVRAIINGIDLAGKTVLDIGCGTGGVDFILAGELEAEHVVAIDIESAPLERARDRLESLHGHLADKIDFKLVSPGPLSWPDAKFDVVFSKDAMIHVPDKAAMYGEVLRVLKPGGVFAASDWLAGANTDSSPEWQRFRELGHLEFTMVTAAEAETMLRGIGFVNVSSTDRNAWYSDVTKQEIRDLEGPLRDRLLDAVDHDIYQHWLELRRALRDTVNVGALRPTHLRAFKPL
ncbi:methyltransferase domain-containing protein [Vacuolonema iberomarrocanum]|uniref:methyltransferase domain-containing protein n=1 Tax=Vacuolonema iberomarrocanum TaxID=3454632 RepID=UPI0019E7759A|nr:methyltransferase domain-containing protein [filamentous cyanobacterium LEGE 07170]